MEAKQEEQKMRRTERNARTNKKRNKISKKKVAENGKRVTNESV